MPEESTADVLATAAQMAARSQGAITEASHPFLADELKAATRAAREFCRWHVAPTRPVTFRRVGATAEDVWLPAMEISSIDAVTIDGVAWTPEQVAAVEFDPSTGWTNLCGRRVVVAYTAGFEEVPADVVTVVLELAALGLGTSLGQTREQAGSVTVTYDRHGGGVDAQGSTGHRLVPYQIGRLP